MNIIDSLFDGPIDVVGDVHGEIEALRSLVHALGYSHDGHHADGRRLVFVGDLIDRGPDSPAVLEWVSRLVDEGRAQCVMGNHELNLLRGVEKPGNGWYTHPAGTPRFPARSVSDGTQKLRFANFIGSLPLVLEREDLRVVHACWNAQALEQVRMHAARGEKILSIYEQYETQVRIRQRDPQLRDRQTRERQRYGSFLTDPAWEPVLLRATAEMDVLYQMGNPVRVLTSGEEQPARFPFWASGKWRMVRRVPWWDSYEDTRPVVVGHYWRQYADARKYIADEREPDLFEGIEHHQWIGAKRNVYCVDLSVGGRPAARSSGAPPYLFKLAALRVPEWQVVHDDGGRWDIGTPGG